MYPATGCNAEILNGFSRAKRAFKTKRTFHNCHAFYKHVPYHMYFYNAKRY